MTKDSPEYQKFKAEYEAKERYKHDHPEEYPWFVYYQFGWHTVYLNSRLKPTFIGMLHSACFIGLEVEDESEV